MAIIEHELVIGGGDDEPLDLPRRTPRMKWDRFVYLCRFWGPVWSWKCVYPYARHDGVGRWRAFCIWIDDGWLGAVWDLLTR